jgi:hypothetical protein
LTHYAAPSFWKRYEGLPEAIRELADKQFQLLKNNPRHPSLHLKRVGPFHSERVGADYRALAVDVEDGCCGFGSARMPSMTASSANLGLHLTAPSEQRKRRFVPLPCSVNCQARSAGAASRRS